MSADDRPTDPMDSTESIDLEAGDTDTRPMNHLEDTMTTPTTAGAPPTVPATPAETPPRSTTPGPGPGPRPLPRATACGSARSCGAW